MGQAASDPLAGQHNRILSIRGQTTISYMSAFDFPEFLTRTKQEVAVVFRPKEAGLAMVAALHVVPGDAVEWNMGAPGHARMLPRNKSSPFRGCAGRAPVQTRGPRR
jgi:hypothetical protein